MTDMQAELGRRQCDVVLRVRVRLRDALQAATLASVEAAIGEFSWALSRRNRQWPCVGRRAAREARCICERSRQERHRDDGPSHGSQTKARGDQALRINSRGFLATNQEFPWQRRDLGNIRLTSRGKAPSGLVSPQVVQYLDYLESELQQRPWFGGDECSAADIQMSYPIQAGAARRPRRFAPKNCLLATSAAASVAQSLATVGRGWTEDCKHAI